jgi:tetratricopeptide (TPR) repeat protein
MSISGRTGFARASVCNDRPRQLDPTGSAVSEKYEVASLDELDRAGSWTRIRGHFGIEAFGVNAWTAAATGDEVISDHNEERSGHEELYIVINGRATFTLDGEEVDAPAGTLVFVDEPKTQRTAVAAVAGTTVLAIGAKPGEAYRPLGWEWSSDAFPYFGSGEPERAYELLAAADAEHPNSPSVLYNLACAEALTGRTEEAVEHLRRAVELYEPFAEIARDDSDFDSIREHPGYAGA